MDETAFRQVLGSMDTQSCPFDKAILAGCCACELAEKHYVAERETVVCTEDSACLSCLKLHGLLRHNSAFALRQIHDEAPITHAQEMKLQCGGLLGLQQALDGADTVADVAGLVAAAQQKFGSLENFPYAQIVQSVASFKLRKRHNAG